MFSRPETYFLRQGTFSFFLLGSVKARDEISEVVCFFFSLSWILKYIRTFAFKFRRRRDNILKQKIFTEEELRIRHEQTEEAIGRDVTARDEISEVIVVFFFKRCQYAIIR